MRSSRPNGRLFLLLVCAMATIAASAASGAGPAPYAQDLAIYDRVLAQAKPGEKWIRFGDVGITTERLRELRQQLIDPNFVTPGGTAFKWPGGNVYYRFNPAQVSNGTITAGKMQQFRDSIAEWAGWANLTFVESISGQANYITVREDPSLGGGFSSAIGMAGGEQFIDFGPNAWNRGTVCHEVGHALGLRHEQQRTDRDTFVVINLGNIPAASQPDFAIVPGSTSHNAYDFYSVMHYERNALAINSNFDTISMQPGYAQFANIIGRVYYRTLSKLDRKGMAEVYGDPSPLPSAMVSNTKESGRGSLRNAIYYAFDRSTDMPPVATTVTFNIPISDAGFAGGVFTIKPTYLMVAPGAGTTIDGATQTTFTGDTNASGPEIVLDGSQIAAQNLSLFAPGFVLVEPNCTIRNLVINGFNQQGIAINGTLASQIGSAATGNVIAGCYIGTDKTGTMAVGNGNTWPGLEISGGASNNTIGGASAAARNLISGNTGYGIFISGAGVTGNLVAGNYLGTNAAGTTPLSNGRAGVAILGGAQNNTIGGLTSGARNLISGNQLQGIVLANPGTNGNVALGNYIGTNAAGTGAVPNGQAGNWPGLAIYNGAQSNVVGGVAPGAANVISGNTAQGVNIYDAGSTSNRVQGNFIGTNSSGTAALPNTWSGVTISGGAQANTIGGTTAAARNIISGNLNQGLALRDGGTSSNLVQGNYLGLDVTGSVALANQFSGVEVLAGAQANTIGGNTPGAGNVISGNSARGIGFFDAVTTGNSVQGNLIGLNAAGTSALPNAFSGVECFLASNNTIGGTTPGARNFISGNADRGVLIDGVDATGNSVIGNTIGLTSTGTAAPNGTQGVAMFTGAHGNTLGGSTPGASNVIAANTQEGVALYDAATIGNRISRNSIFSNHIRGISLFTGANNNQSAPTLTAATLSPTGNPNGTTVDGTATGAGTLEFFANPAGGAEGRIFIGTLSVAGAGSFSASLAATVPAGYVITSTATSGAGSTSQFSATQTVATSDGDGDGLPDNWMLAHFGHSDPRANDLSRANDDADGDGLTNIEELRAGTDPRLATSGLRITAVARTPADFSLTFSSVAGRTYRIEAKDNFVLPTWTLLQDQINATGGSTSITDFGAGLGPSRAYRVSIVP